MAPTMFTAVSARMPIIAPMTLVISRAQRYVNDVMDIFRSKIFARWIFHPDFCLNNQ